MDGGSVWVPKRRWREGFHNSMKTSSQNNAMAQTSLSKARIVLLFISQTSDLSLDSGFKPCFTSTAMPGRKGASKLYLLCPFPFPGDCQVQQHPVHRARVSTHHGCPTVAQDGWLGSQGCLLHDAGGGDGQGDEVKCNYNCQVRSEHQHLGSWHGERDTQRWWKCWPWPPHATGEQARDLCLPPEQRLISQCLQCNSRALCLGKNIFC